MAPHIMDGLRVENALFDLGLSDEDFTDIEQKARAFGEGAEAVGRNARYTLREAGDY